jgi:deoxyribodipyrimidine photo-lyase
VDGTSRLSPALAVGAISIRRVFDAVIRARADVVPNERTGYDAFINELIWREFFYSILEHFPHAADGPLREQAATLRWNQDRRLFARWVEGTTGFPIVDAGMRQLAQEGWMHNRVRMIVGSFLVKDLRINWQWGERHFLDSLCDADIACNNGGWQWVAGTGTDAAPWFRIFNPALQGKRFDPEGAYVRRYVPELRNVPARYIHAPETMPPALQKDVGCIAGRDYPAPIVNHAKAAREFRQWFQHRPLSKQI